MGRGELWRKLEDQVYSWDRWPAYRASIWPTPQANPLSGSRNTPGSKAHAGISLSDAVLTGKSEGRETNTRRLNANFVGWLMGFPMWWHNVLPRHDALRGYGNAIVPDQGSYAIFILLQALR